MNKLFSNKKAQTSLTKTGILLVVTIFYTTLFVLIGYFNTYFAGYATNVDTGNPNDSGFFSFIDNVITGIELAPVWLNSILFGSLVFIYGWIIFSSLPTFNGGG